MRKPYALALTLAALLLLGAACEKAVTNENENENENENRNGTVQNVNSVRNVNDDDGIENENENGNENSNGNSNSNTNSDDDESSAVTNGTLSVTKPERNEDVDSPFTVKGTASGDQVFVRVKNSAGTALFTVPVTVRSGAFSVNLTYEFVNTTNGTVEVFQRNAAGTETNLVTVPLTFKVEDAEDDSNSNDNSNTNESEDESTDDNSNTNSDD